MVGVVCCGKRRSRERRARAQVSVFGGWEYSFFVAAGRKLQAHLLGLRGLVNLVCIGPLAAARRCAGITPASLYQRGQVPPLGLGSGAQGARSCALCHPAQWSHSGNRTDMGKAPKGIVALRLPDLFFFPPASSGLAAERRPPADPLLFCRFSPLPADACAPPSPTAHVHK